MTTPVNSIAQAAAEAAPAYGSWSARRRRDLLHSCADRLEKARAELVELAMVESRLGRERLEGELTRTTNQLQLLGDHVAHGRHLNPRRSEGVAQGGADVVSIDLPLGPVAVFAASNFPFAFGVTGGDTASVLAAGCPVVVKGHPAQPELNRRLAALMAEAIDAAEAPAGTFGFIEGASYEVSLDLVRHPAIRAVAFTGSLRGGRALMDAAAGRPDPIPVYAEMGSINPVFVLPEAAADPQWAQTLARSVLGSAGQLCTKPGVIIVPDTDAGRSLAAAITEAVAAADPQPMLTEGMASAHRTWHVNVASADGATVTPAPDEQSAGELAEGPVGAPFTVTVAGGRLDGDLLTEHFGPTAVLAATAPESYAAVAERIDGQLTATIVAAPGDRELAAGLLPTLAARAGRVVWNGVPTGVAVCEAMQHGGPWPATSASWSTSVGTEAIRRFLRPVAFQGVPDELIATVGAAHSQP